MGRYRKKSAKRHHVASRLADKEYIFITTLANELDKSVSEIVRELIKFAMFINPEKAIKYLKRKGEFKDF